MVGGLCWIIGYIVLLTKFEVIYKMWAADLYEDLKLRAASEKF